jgi:hypothetical protein
VSQERAMRLNGGRFGMGAQQRSVPDEVAERRRGVRGQFKREICLGGGVCRSVRDEGGECGSTDTGSAQDVRAA